MIELRVHRPVTLCDWCGREHVGEAVVVTVVTPRITFREELCEDCGAAFKAPE